MRKVALLLVMAFALLIFSTCSCLEPPTEIAETTIDTELPAETTQEEIIGAVLAPYYELSDGGSTITFLRFDDGFGHKRRLR